MEDYRLGEMEKRFADLLWARAPLKTKAVLELGKRVFNWKRTTTYTMLKRLIDRGLFTNKGGLVEVLMDKEDFLAGHGRVVLDELYEGSLPLFLTSFTRKHKLSSEEILAIRRLIDDQEVKGHD